MPTEGGRRGPDARLVASERPPAKRVEEREARLGDQAKSDRPARQTAEKRNKHAASILAEFDVLSRALLIGAEHAERLKADLKRFRPMLYKYSLAKECLGRLATVSNKDVISFEMLLELSNDEQGLLLSKLAVARSVDNDYTQKQLCHYLVPLLSHLRMLNAVYEVDIPLVIVGPESVQTALRALPKYNVRCSFVRAPMRPHLDPNTLMPTGRWSGLSEGVLPALSDEAIVQAMLKEGKLVLHVTELSNMGGTVDFSLLNTLMQTRKSGENEETGREGDWQEETLDSNPAKLLVEVVDASLHAVSFKNSSRLVRVKEHVRSVRACQSSDTEFESRHKFAPVGMWISLPWLSSLIQSGDLSKMHVAKLLVVSKGEEHVELTMNEFDVIRKCAEEQRVVVVVPPCRSPRLGVAVCVDELHPSQAALFYPDGVAIEGVPETLAHLFCLARHGATEEGVYRRAGSERAIRALKDALSSATPPAPPGACGVHVTTAVLKRELRGLGVITEEGRTVLLELNAETERGEAPGARRWECFVGSLPRKNRSVLVATLRELEYVVRFSAVNKMTTRNITICIAQSLFRHAEGRDAKEELAAAAVDAHLLQLLLHHTTDVLDAYVAIEKREKAAECTLDTLAHTTRRRIRESEKELTVDVGARYCLVRSLEHGSFGESWLACHSLVGCDVVLRMTSSASDACVSEVERVVSLMASVPTHPHLVRLLELLPIHTPILVYEFVAGGSVGAVVEKAVRETGRRLSTRLACRVIAGVLAALHHLHKHHIVHTAVNPNTVLVTVDYTAKLGGWSTICEVDDRGEVQAVPTSHTDYTAPETDTSERYDGYSADAWSAGAVFYYVINGCAPMKGGDEVARQLEGLRLKRDVEETGVGRALRRLLNVDPMRRASVGRAKTYSCFVDSNATATEEGLSDRDDAVTQLATWLFPHLPTHTAVHNVNKELKVDPRGFLSSTVTLLSAKIEKGGSCDLPPLVRVTDAILQFGCVDLDANGHPFYDELRVTAPSSLSLRLFLGDRMAEAEEAGDREELDHAMRALAPSTRRGQKMHSEQTKCKWTMTTADRRREAQHGRPGVRTLLKRFVERRLGDAHPSEVLPECAVQQADHFNHPKHIPLKRLGASGVAERMWWWVWRRCRGQPRKATQEEMVRVKKLPTCAKADDVVRKLHRAFLAHNLCHIVHCEWTSEARRRLRNGKWLVVRLRVVRVGGGVFGVLAERLGVDQSMRDHIALS